MKFSITLAVAAILPSILALPTLDDRVEAGITALLKKRQSCAYYCGNVCYYQSDVDAAVNEGYSDYSNGEEEGGSTYPHAENNYEGFDFYCSGPYQEFPILKSYQVYSGGAPGPDRVVFCDSDGSLAGVVTHTGASGNDFVQCSSA